MTLLRTYSIIDIVRRQGLTNIGKAVHMKEMGMTDKQFNGFIRFLIDEDHPRTCGENTKK